MKPAQFALGWGRGQKVSYKITQYMLLRNFLFLVLFFGGSLLASISHVRAQAGSGPHLTFDIKSGDVFSARGIHDQWYPASLTKVMTAYTVFREIKRGRITMQSPVRVSSKALSMPPSKMGFPVGTVLTVENALRIINVKSANDVAMAIAESVGGSEVQFVNLMNRYARDIGMERSQFANPHGLHNPRQYSTAHDLGVLTRQIYREFPKHAHMFAIPAIKVGRRTLRNHNTLLRKLPGTIGFKTGFICAGGVSLIATRETGDRLLVSILLGERRARLRNLKVAEFLTAGSAPDAVALNMFDEISPPVNPQPPQDISDYVCGRKRAPQTELFFADPAIEFFAIKRPAQNTNASDREAAVFNNEVESGDTVLVKLGGSDGPDPYGLLVEKPPLALAVSDVSKENRHAIDENRVVATPTPSPRS